MSFSPPALPWQRNQGFKLTKSEMARRFLTLLAKEKDVYLFFSECSRNSVCFPLDRPGS